MTNKNTELKLFCDEQLTRLDQMNYLKRIKISHNDSIGILCDINEHLITYSLPLQEQYHKLKSQIDKNEKIVLNSLVSFINISEISFDFSKILYNRQNDIPIDIYRQFRKLSQNFTQMSHYLHQYDSFNNQFLKQKQNLIQQQLSVCQNIEQNTQIQSNGYLRKKQKSRKFKDSRSQQTEQIQILQDEIKVLQKMLQTNDQQFEIEIQKYNNVLYDLQQTIRRYEIQMNRFNEYESIIEDLQSTIIRIREQKYRDDIVIENMARKIRYLEKERGGNNFFTNPTYHERKSRNTAASPDYNKQSKLSRVNSAKDIFAKKYYQMKIK